MFSIILLTLLSGYLTIDLGSNLTSESRELTLETAFKDLGIECAFLWYCSSSGSHEMLQFVKKLLN